MQDLQAVNRAVVPRASTVPDPHTLGHELSPKKKCFSVLTSVIFHVENQVTTLSETFTTYFTDVRLLTCMHSHVGSKTTTLGKTFSTCVASIWLFTCVSSKVVSQMMIATETSTA